MPVGKAICCPGLRPRLIMRQFNASCPGVTMQSSMSTLGLIHHVLRPIKLLKVGQMRLQLHQSFRVVPLIVHVRWNELLFRALLDVVRRRKSSGEARHSLPFTGSRAATPFPQNERTVFAIRRGVILDSRGDRDGLVGYRLQRLASDAVLQFIGMRGYSKSGVSRAGSPRGGRRLTSLHRQRFFCHIFAVSIHSR